MPEVSKTTDGALNILEYLGDRGGTTIAEVARDLGLSRTVAYRLLSTLEVRGFIRRTAGVYRLGPKLFALAQHVEWAVRDAAHSHMATLVDSLRETVVLVVRDRWESLSVHRIVSRDHIVQVSYPPGLRHHILATGSGKVMAAFGDEDELHHLAGDDRALASELARIRRRGYTSGNEENQSGLWALAAPISSIDGVAASVAVYTPTDKDRVAAVSKATDQVVAAAEAISTQLTSAEA
ncbi:IclR family transcriptional regulator [Actinomadura madurae]|uniref:IclR family transcriptional regulator n=1 Tax=Actinomadura madurae TaxID=1993 RepID=UPI0020D21E23|nr:IclR family transcriptional regulator [Actinomadura madurae]MCP9951938.1 IclR family transcriptional regulator [Actinomadura madurae]MCP9968706.1 IclR family transcriptional regulator [Actinomadura madurae]MCP9981182.1 IclR family transcriptional regulator [Actinomadura madurae]MCQ0007323.1 IclR family transcriptional regulator [Actinomadura madurae]MCQ0017372.1 IclR family transcriptional regulator [Actinomadura madurae]